MDQASRQPYLPDEVKASIMIRVKVDYVFRHAEQDRPVRFQIDLDANQFSQRIMLNHFQQRIMYEPETSRFLATMLSEGDTFIDVGAHVGYFTLLASSLVGSQGRIISFEPHQENYRRLLDHIHLNNLTNVLPHHWAVGKQTGVKELYLNVDNDGGHALWEVGQHPFNVKSRAQVLKQPVFTYSLDQLLPSLTGARRRIIKIDTEGNEHNVVLGARELLSQPDSTFVICEINRFGLAQMGSSEEALRNFMVSMGYETLSLDGKRGYLARLGANEYLEADQVFNVVFAPRVWPGLPDVTS